MDKTTTTLSTNHILKGNAYSYHIEKVLGQGSFGITYLASTRVKIPGPLGEIETEVKVAVKEFFMKEFCSRHEDGIITEMTAGSLIQNYSKKFRKEAENLAKLSHPNIVKVLEVFNANNTCYYSMEYIAGESLDEYVNKCGGLPENEAIACIGQIGAAVQYMHDHKMLHLDLKPSNVMRSENGKKMVLIDFGLSKQYGANGKPETTTTIGLGTSGYAPIEQSKTDRDKDFAPTLDVYALGATFFKLLTGIAPPDSSDVFDAGLPLEMLNKKGVANSSINAIKASMKSRKSERLSSVDAFLSLLSESSGTGEDNTDYIDNMSDDHPEPSYPSWLKWIIIAAATVIIVILGYKMCAGTVDYSAADITFRMIRVQGGSFQMGASYEIDSDAYMNETPVHMVKLSSYYIGETEVTQALWETVMGNNPSHVKDPNLPVDNVSWEDCHKFIDRLNAWTGAEFRLPTEAEWEYAARGGKRVGRNRYCGSDTLSNVAWYDGNSDGKPHPVKEKAANELGVYDMSGNVWEWCSDTYSPYRDIFQTNPLVESPDSERVCRGGGWNVDSKYCRVSNRGRNSPNLHFDNHGFRLAL